MLIAFDIETGPSSDMEKALSIKPFDPGRLKDPEKIKAKEKEHAEKFALYPTTGEILTIGYQTKHGPLLETRWDFSEQELITRFWDLFAKEVASSTNLLCGWCITVFDLPFIMQRSRILGIRPPVKVMQSRSWHPRIRDLERLWSCYVYGKFMKLDEACKALGWEPKPAEGKNFAKHFKDEPSIAIEYAMHDMKQTYRMADHLLGDD